jgi:hypothetical protein
MKAPPPKRRRHQAAATEGDGVDPVVRRVGAQAMAQSLVVAQTISAHRNKHTHAALPWVECFDPESGSPYYYNHDSGDSYWNKPASFVPTSEDPEMCAIVRVQCLFRMRRAVAKTWSPEAAKRVIGERFTRESVNAARRGKMIKVEKSYTHPSKTDWVESYDSKVRRIRTRHATRDTRHATRDTLTYDIRH